jgi:hypothetical protein
MFGCFLSKLRKRLCGLQIREYFEWFFFKSEMTCYIEIIRDFGYTFLKFVNSLKCLS